MRVFSIEGTNTVLYESKFLVDNIQVSAADVKQMWPQLSLEEQIEFASAFSTQPPRHRDDHEILEFLLEVGPEHVWRTIAILLPFHSDRQRILTFLSDRLSREPLQRANYFQAAEALQAREITDIIRRHFQEYRKVLKSDLEAPRNLRLWIDYLQCCKTLFALTKDPNFSAALSEGIANAPQELRGFTTGIAE